MNTARPGALARRLGQFIDLTALEASWAARLEAAPRACARGDDVLAPGASGPEIAVICSGWAVCRTQGAAGRSMITRLYLPGDIVGLPDIGLTEPAYGVTMRAAGSVARFRRQELPALFAAAPRLAALLSALEGIERVILQRQLVALGTRSARVRIILAILQIRARLAASVADVGTGNRFAMPLTQVELGEATGLSPVWVSRTLREFVDQGELEIDRPYMRLLRRAEWEAESGFTDLHAKLDTSWLNSAKIRSSKP